MNGIKGPKPAGNQGTPVSAPKIDTTSPSQAAASGTPAQPAQPSVPEQAAGPVLSDASKKQRTHEKKMSSVLRRASMSYMFEKEGTMPPEKTKSGSPASDSRQAPPALTRRKAETDLRSLVGKQDQPIEGGLSSSVAAKAGITGAAASTASSLQKYGPEVMKDFTTMTDELKVQLPELQAKVKSGGYVLPEEKEKLKRLEALQKRLDTEPASKEYFAAEIAANRKDALYKHLGPTKFCSMLADVDNNIKNGGKDGKPLPTYGWSTMEKVALYGYTTKDYGDINPAMRSEGGKPKDPGIAAYAKHATHAMKKMPDYEGDGKDSVLYRALFQPNPKTASESAIRAFEKLKFKEGGTYSDPGFASHSNQLVPGGTWSLQVQGTKNAKDLGPYSVWPGEKEILVVPGTKFDVVSVEDKKVTLKSR